METRHTRPLIAITMGDPAGIGAEVSLKALQRAELYDLCRPLLLGTLAVVEQTRMRLGSDQQLHAIADPAAGEYVPGHVDFPWAW
jgi:4-hydroxythreonine-4-phosphate dehydrogenase